jgi:hypothetical protein
MLNIAIFSLTLATQWRKREIDREREREREREIEEFHIKTLSFAEIVERRQ